MLNGFHLNAPWKTFVLSAGIAFLSTITSAAQAMNFEFARSDFSIDDENWTLTGDSTSPTPTYFSSGGNPEGYINGTDLGLSGAWYFNAPDKFLGDVSIVLGGTLSYDLRQRNTGGPFFEQPDVILNGGGLQLVFDTTPTPTDPDWTSYSITLDASAGWKVGDLSGILATQSQLNTVLSNLEQLRIRGEFITGTDNGDLDNVILRQIPEPLTILGASTASGFGAFFKRELNKSKKNKKDSESA